MSVPIEIIWPRNSDKPDSKLVARVGRKAIGIIRIPDAWRPPFFVLSASTFSMWKVAQNAARRAILEAASAAIVEGASYFQPDWTAGLILRSSAVEESLIDRGAYQSKSLAADFDIQAISKNLLDVFAQFEGISVEGELAIVVQPLVPGPRRYTGHVSNERRVSKTINQWMLECPEADWIERFNSQRSEAADTREGLVAENARQLIRTFRAVGRWCTQLDSGPCHIEWVWSNGQLRLLQLDFEDDSPDAGVDPRIFIRPTDAKAVGASVGCALKKVDVGAPPTGWGKIDKIKGLGRPTTPHHDCWC